jgi:hypothetical protein
MGDSPKSSRRSDRLSLAHPALRRSGGEFLFVPDDQVMETARREEATPFDVPGVELGHHGSDCSFDAFLHKYKLTDPALQALALIVRGADTDARDLAKEAWGLYAVASGFRETSVDDHENMARQFPVYDALYAYCRTGHGT